MMNQPMNDTLRGIVLCSDDPEHLAEFTIDDSWLPARTIAPFIEQ
jgi:hypothetical protein